MIEVLHPFPQQYIILSQIDRELHSQVEDLHLYVGLALPICQEVSWNRNRTKPNASIQDRGFIEILGH